MALTSHPTSTSPNTTFSWGGLRVVVSVLAALVLSVILLCAFLFVREFDARTQAQLKQHQTQEADLWARMLTSRLEAHQRWLNSLADGLHTSMLDKPAVIEALLRQEGSMLRLFESLHVALPSGTVTNYGALGAVTALDDQGTQALRRTVAEGKSFMTAVSAVNDNQHLRVFISVPMRRDDGHVSGALAATVKLPLAALLPDMEQPADHRQYMLVDSEGLVLAHSDVVQRGQNIQTVLGASGDQRLALSQPFRANADTQQWSHWLVTRVGLPLPQWQLAVLRDTSGDVLMDQGLPPRAWLGLSAGALLLTALAAWLLWGGLTPWLRRVGIGGRSSPAAERTMDEAEEEEDAQTKAQAQRLSLHAGAMAMFEAVPSAMMLEHEARITLVTQQLSVMLGYFGEEAERLSMEQLFENPVALAAVRKTLVELGSYEGTLKLRKKDGDSVLVDVLAWTPSQLSSATVWRLQLPWRQRRAVPLPLGQQAWQDKLTGMPNREALMWSLQSWIADSIHPEKTGIDNARRVPAQGCLLFADLDHLGMMNETTDREMGNKLLRHVGRLIASYSQPLGSVARLGGDEFAVLLPGISLAHAQGIGQALCDAVWRWQPSWGGERHWVSISVGIVAMDALRHTPQQAVHAADMACYEAKRRGRCQVAVGQITAPTLRAQG